MLESLQTFFEDSSTMMRLVLALSIILLAPRLFQRVKLPGVLALIFAGMGQGIFAEPLLHGASLVGGICGGLAYWAIAGKHSGGWKQTP